MITKSIYEMLDEVDRAKGEKAKLELLKKYSSPALKAVIGHAMDPGVKWLLPETDPPYKANPEEMDLQGRLQNEHRKFYLFIAGQNTTLTKTKREMLFIQFLEGLDPKDAKLMLHVKNKKLPFKSITPALIKKAFPKLAEKW